MTNSPQTLPLPRDERGRVVRALLYAQHVLFIVLLGVGAARSFFDESNHAVLWGSVILAGWYVSGIWIGTRSTSRPLALTWLVTLTVGWVFLAFASPEFIWVAFALFFLYLHFVPGFLGYLAVGALLLVAIIAQTGVRSASDLPQLPEIVGPIFGAAIAVGMSLAYQRLVEENQYRLQLVRDLEATNTNLLATQDQLARMQHEAGMLAERTRLAREIHDTVAQGLASIVLLSRAGDEDPILQQIGNISQENLEEVRRVVQHLQPQALEEAPLPAALQRLADDVSKRSGIPIHLEVSGTPEGLATNQEVALLRIAQSALANVQQHSGAEEAVVKVTYASEQISMIIADDGAGFVVGSAEHVGGFGLRAMRDRTTELGGEVTVTSEPNEGTTITVWLPLGGRFS